MPGYKLESVKCLLRPKQGLTHYFTLKKLDFIDVTGRGLGETSSEIDEPPEGAHVHEHDAAATDLDDLPEGPPEDVADAEEPELIDEAEIIED